MTHSIISPSSAGVWGRPGGCIGYPQVKQKYPEGARSESAIQGDAAHYVAACILAEVKKGFFRPDPAPAWLGKTDPNGTVITQEIVDSVRVYVKDVVLTVHAAHEIFVEEQVTAPSIHPQLFGTVDCWAVDLKKKDIVIWDLKHGFLSVDVFENWQLISYAAGILDKIGINGLTDQTTRIRFRIVQPRGFHRDGPIREWSVRASDLRGYFNLLKLAASRAADPNDLELHTGEQCRFCPARYACDAAIEAAAGLYEMTADGEPAEMTNEMLSRKYAVVQRAVNHLKYLETGLSEQITTLIRNGHKLPGYIVEPTYSRESWHKPVDEVIAMGDIMGQDLRKPGAITPKQARDLGIDAVLIKSYAGSKQSGYRIVADDGKKANQIFGVK